MPRRKELVWDLKGDFRPGFESFYNSYDPRGAEPDQVIKQTRITIHLPNVCAVDEIDGFRDFTETYESADGFTIRFVCDSLSILMVKARHVFKDSHGPYDWSNLTCVYGTYCYADAPEHFYPRNDS